MKVGILGTGDVAQSLARGFLALGHEVMLGSREPNHLKAMAWAKSQGSKASAGTFAQAAAFGEWVALATLGTATENAIRLADPKQFRGKIVLDATNPLDMSKGVPPTLVGGVGDSGGEKHQRLLPDAKVVKAFNTVGNALFFHPDFPDGTPDMFVCGNDAGAKTAVGALCKDFGWNVVDVGGIGASHYLEAMCIVWVTSGFQLKNFNIAFKFLRK